MFVVPRLLSGKVKVVWTGGYASTSGFGFWLLLLVPCVFGSVLFIKSIFVFYFLLSVEGELVDGVGHKKESLSSCAPLLYL